jgi:hypothetical protein
VEVVLVVQEAVVLEVFYKVLCLYQMEHIRLKLELAEQKLPVDPEVRHQKEEMDYKVLCLV